MAGSRLDGIDDVDLPAPANRDDSATSLLVAHARC
jgi:hypothetical protein